jgi:hypothetical protein
MSRPYSVIRYPGDQHCGNCIPSPSQRQLGPCYVLRSRNMETHLATSGTEKPVVPRFKIRTQTHYRQRLPLQSCSQLLSFVSRAVSFNGEVRENGRTVAPTPDFNRKSLSRRARPSNLYSPTGNEL